MFRKKYREFFCIPKYRKITNRRFRAQISLLILSIVMCCTALCATTFAWFTAQQGAKVEPIVAAEYSVQISIDGNAINTESSTFSLAKEDKHTVTITANGTATSGYVVIKVGGNTYSTQQIPKGQSITITITAAQGEQIRFEAFWGENLSQSALCNGSTLYISQTPYVTYTVAEGATLDQISEYYGVSKEDILRYNGISGLTVGQEIKIPKSKVTEPLTVQNVEDTEETEESTEGTTEEPTEDSVISEEPFTEPNTDPNEPTEIPEESDIESNDPESTEEGNPDTEPYSEN